MLYLEKMKMHTITSGNYVTSVHGMVHPNRIIGEHDFLSFPYGSDEQPVDGADLYRASGNKSTKTIFPL